MPLSLKSLVIGEYCFVIALRHVERRGEGCLCARGQEARARSGSVGQNMVPLAPARPSNRKALFLSLQQC